MTLPCYLTFIFYFFSNFFSFKSFFSRYNIGINNILSPLTITIFETDPFDWRKIFFSSSSFLKTKVVYFFNCKSRSASLFEFSVFEKLSLLCRPGVLNLLVLTYPQLRIVPLCVPPNQNCNPFAYPQIKNSTQINLFLVGFKIWRTPCELLAYPEGYAYPRLSTADVDYCSQQRMDSWKARRWRDELVLSLFFGIVSKFIYLLFTTDLYTKMHTGWKSRGGGTGCFCQNS